MFIYLSFYSTGLHNKICHTWKSIFYECRGWSEEPSCMVWHRYFCIHYTYICVYSLAECQSGGKQKHTPIFTSRKTNKEAEINVFSCFFFFVIQSELKGMSMAHTDMKVASNFSFYSWKIINQFPKMLNYFYRNKKEYHTKSIFFALFTWSHILVGA